MIDGLTYPAVCFCKNHFEVSGWFSPAPPDYYAKSIPREKSQIGHRSGDLLTIGASEAVTKEKGVQSARLFIMNKILRSRVKKETYTLP